tara:strand:- start:21249 stop:22262 length:1014 start_codon:yes stop_codon:yes gene_type:complete
MKRISISLFFLFQIVVALSQTTEVHNPIGKNELIITHQYYTVSYLNQYKQAEWVAYQITDSTAFGNQNRANSFKEDASAHDIPLKPYYVKSGYDRGHLCPAGSMAFNATAMTESFYMTNMSPQAPGFNRGIWKKLESQVRTWGYENKAVFVVTGPILTQFQDTIGQIPVPAYFYKVILDKQEPSLKAIAFILANTSSSLDLSSYVVSIDSVEYVTGIDFFASLPDSLENLLEQKSHPELWSWKPIQVTKTKSSTPLFSCIGLTKSGVQCSRTVTDSNGYCWQHQPKTTEQMVWVCGKSKIYHVSKDHGALKRCKSGIREITLTEALKLGLRMCKEKN